MVQGIHKIFTGASVAALERHLTNIEKARKAEEQMYREISENCAHAPFAR